MFVDARKTPLSELSAIFDGSGPLDGGFLLVDEETMASVTRSVKSANQFFKKFVGSQELISGQNRWCIWVEDEKLDDAKSINFFSDRFDQVYKFRSGAGTRAKTAQNRPHKFAWINRPLKTQIIIPKVFSENRNYITAGYLSSDTIVSNRACILCDVGLYEFSLVSSKMHWAWIGAVCVRLEMRYSYSGTLGWNNFPVPPLTEKNKADLTRCAEDILLAREAHFPKTIADLYDPEKMPEDLRRAHDRNDEILERIYIGRRFKNDTERLEKLFALYTKMVAGDASARRDKKGAS